MDEPIRKAVLPVAGLGTRFLPATKAVPKEMLTVVDRPILQYVVDEAREAGIEHFIFVTGRNKGVIEDHFDYAYELEDTSANRSQSFCRTSDGSVVFRKKKVLGFLAERPRCVASM
jgi:UTP--glucose-1-phosphate uridylyltransferase